MNLTLKIIIRQALIAAIYFCLTLITYPISFLGIQFRVAEMLIILCFFRRDYVIGITLGCVLANLTSSIGLIDSLIGGGVTLIVCLFLSFCKHLFVGCIFAVVANSFVVGAELFWILKEPFWISVGLVAIGEVTVLIVAYVLVQIFKRKKFFYKVIDANRNLEFKI